jgi:hypothetical protein
MEEILFKAKELNGDKWVEGSLMTHGNCTYILPEDCVTPFGILKTRVIPETVAQFIGLTDKNEMKIFRGDKCKLYTPQIENHPSQIVEVIVTWKDFSWHLEGFGFLWEVYPFGKITSEMLEIIK